MPDTARRSSRRIVLKIYIMWNNWNKIKVTENTQLARNYTGDIVLSPVGGNVVAKYY